MALLLNILNVSLLIYVTITLIKKHIDSSLIWYNLATLYFINFPLLVDSFMISYTDSISWEAIIVKGFESWDIGMFKYLNKVSSLSFIFNLFVNIPYLIITPITKKQYKFKTVEESKNLMFPWWVYISISWAAILFFMFNFNLSSIAYIGAGEWYTKSIGNPIINLITKTLVTFSGVCILKLIITRNIFLGSLAAIPILLIVIITEARSQFIAIAFFILYYYIQKSSEKNFQIRKFILLGFAGLALAYLMSFFRVADTEAIYPISKDVSYSDMFYSIKYGDHLSTEGSNTKRLVLTGLYNYKVKEDIPELLADYKFFKGWGTLHPTIIGWAYIDLQSNSWLLALFISIFLSICDRLRHNIKYKYSLFYLSSIFTFIAVAVRGSVQFAYAQIIYVTIAFFLFYLYKKIYSAPNKIYDCRPKSKNIL